jgi:polysaccharide pyruvyl transferase WcaK-like protein
VSVRDWSNTEHFIHQLAWMCDQLRQKYGLEVLFLHMQPSRDREITAQVRAQMKEHSYVLDTPCRPQELMAVLGRAKLCLAMRLHTLIFAARMAVPAMGLIYDPKVDSYLQELELPAAGYVESFDGQEAMRRADALMADYDAVLARLKEKSAALTAAARENEQMLLELLEHTKK